MLSSISNLVPAVVWTLASGAVLTIGDLLLRSWFETKWTLGFEVALLFYVLGVLCMMMSFFQQNIAIATVAAIIVNTLAYLLITRVLYGDTISAWSIVGLVLGLAALTILELA